MRFGGGAQTRYERGGRKNGRQVVVAAALENVRTVARQRRRERSTQHKEPTKEEGQGEEGKKVDSCTGAGWAAVCVLYGVGAAWKGQKGER